MSSAFLTLTPYDFWRSTHALHHASSGNLDHRGIGDIDTLTVDEFLALSWERQLLYRLYRHPIVMFGIGPAYLFILRHRLPMGLIRSGWHPWLSTMATNVAIAVVAATMIWLAGIGPFLFVQLPITLVAASVGVWLFYVQHQFEDTFWAVTAIGMFIQQVCSVVLTMNCRASFAGLPQISACITFIIYAVEFLITGYRRSYGITLNSPLSDGLRCFRASNVYAGYCGMKGDIGLFPFVRYRRALRVTAAFCPLSRLTLAVILVWQD